MIMRIQVSCPLHKAVFGMSTSIEKCRALVLDSLRQSSLARQESDRHFISSVSAISVSSDGF